MVADECASFLTGPESSIILVVIYTLVAARYCRGDSRGKIKTFATVSCAYTSFCVVTMSHPQKLTGILRMYQHNDGGVEIRVGKGSKQRTGTKVNLTDVA